MREVGERGGVEREEKARSGNRVVVPGRTQHVASAETTETPPESWRISVGVVLTRWREEGGGRRGSPAPRGIRKG